MRPTLDEVFRREGFAPCGPGRWEYVVGGSVLAALADGRGGVLLAVSEAGADGPVGWAWRGAAAGAVEGAVTLGKAWLYSLLTPPGVETPPPGAGATAADRPLPRGV